MKHLSYAAMLAVVLVATLPLERLLRTRVLARPRRLAATLALAGAPFLAWDLYATSHGHWSFDPAQTLRPRVGGLPLEEVAFFVVIPLAIVFAFQAVRAVTGWDSDAEAHEKRRGPVTYTQLALAGVLAAVAVDLAVLRVRLLGTRAFWAAYGVVVFFQLLSNGWLTGRGIVRYDPAQILGARLAYAPVEDLLFGFALALWSLDWWVWLGRARAKRI